MYTLDFSTNFDADTDQIYDYIKVTLEAPKAANALFETLINKLNYISETPC
jgi:hypothetical protein